MSDRGARSKPTEGSVLANTGALVGGRLVVAAFGWAGTLLIVRHLSLEQWGEFSFVFAFLGLLSIITDLGIGRIVIGGLAGEGAAEDPGELAGTYIVLRGVLGLIGYGVAVAFVTVFNYPATVVHITMVAGLVVVITTPAHAFDAIYQANLRMPVVAMANVLGQASQFALTIAVVVVGPSMIRFAIPAVLAELVVGGWKVAHVGALLRPRYRISLLWWRRMIVEAVPLAIGGALGTVYYRVDAVMLSKFDHRTFSSVGIYNVAYKFVDVLHFFPMALMAPVLTLLIRAWPGDPAEFGRIYRRAFTLLCLSGALLIAEFCVFARPVIGLLYGRQYAVGAAAARLVVASEGVHFFTLLAFTALVATGRHRLYPIATLSGVVVNVGLNLWLIPAYSYPGAAWATIVTEVIVMSLLWSGALKIDGVRPIPVGRVVRVVMAAGLSVAAGYGAWRVAPWPVAVAVVALVYLAVVSLTHATGPGGLRGLVQDDAAGLAR